jgi:hypothetical protein
VFVLEHCFESKSFAALHEEFSSTPTGNKISDGCFPSLRWRTFSASSVKLFCKFFVTNKDEETRLSCYMGVTEGY